MQIRRSVSGGSGEDPGGRIRASGRGSEREKLCLWAATRTAGTSPRLLVERFEIRRFDGTLGVGRPAR